MEEKLEKLVYTAPVLTVLGTVVELTKSACGSSMPRPCGCPPGSSCPHELWTCS